METGTEALIVLLEENQWETRWNVPAPPFLEWNHRVEGYKSI